MKGIYHFSWGSGRGGEVCGLFVATADAVAQAVGKDVYFGEILGKHSDVSGVISEGDIKLVSAREEHVAMFEELALSIGSNPLECTEEHFTCAKCDERMLLDDMSYTENLCWNCFGE